MPSKRILIRLPYALFVAVCGTQSEIPVGLSYAGNRIPSHIPYLTPEESEL